MKKMMIYLLGTMLVLGTTYSAIAASGAISNEYHGMWGAGGCNTAKYYMHIEDSGMQMYAADKRMPLGNWDVRKVEDNGNGIIVDTQETNSKQETHMELTKLPNGHLSLMLKIGGNGGMDELVGC